jgi:Family of unknown function (DUF6169)
MPTYQFTKLDTDDICYTFQTAHDFHYEVYFVHSSYYFPENIHFNQNVFELVIKLLDSERTLKTVRDANIPPTIASIFVDFFKDHEKVVVFSCDSSDNKQAARHRKFDDCFLKFNDDSFDKLNGIIEDTTYHVQYFMSMILRRDNPFKNEIVNAFEELTVSLSSAK